MFIIVRIGHCNIGSNLGLFAFSHCAKNLLKSMNPIILLPAIGK